MTIYIHGSIVTNYGIAANNRGETSGNGTQLQYIEWKGETHTTISAEAKRYALRCMMERNGLPVNRCHAQSPEGLNMAFEWKDPLFKQSSKMKFADDDVLGYMCATKTKKVEEEDETDNKSTVKRTGRLSINRSISLDPHAGDISCNFASPGASPKAVSEKAKKKNDLPTPVPYTAEFHATRYQFPFTLEPQSLISPEYAPDVIRMICSLYQVGGNHSRYYYDFSAESVFLRLTTQPAHRMSYCFKHDDDFNVLAPDIVERVKSGDVKANELFVGGAISKTETGRLLMDAGVVVEDSVDRCVEQLLERLASE